MPAETVRPTPPTLTYLATFAVTVSQTVDVGAVPGGERRVVPITGGRADGVIPPAYSPDGDEHAWTGRVLPLGADYQVHHGPILALLEAKYVVETDDGTRLYVDNTAMRSGSADDVAALARGEQVDPDRIYFRCWPRVSAPEGSRFGWLNSRLLVGVGRRAPEHVQIELFVID